MDPGREELAASRMEPRMEDTSLGARIVYYIAVAVLVCLTVALTAIGSVAATLWFARQGLHNLGVLKGLVVLPVVSISGALFFIIQSALDRVLLGIPRETDAVHRDRADQCIRIADDSNRQVQSPNGPSKRHLVVALLCAPFVLAGIGVVFYAHLLPLLSYDVRKDRMQRAVVEILRREGPLAAGTPHVDLEQDAQGLWNGTADYQDLHYEVQVETVNGFHHCKWWKK